MTRCASSVAAVCLCTCLWAGALPSWAADEAAAYFPCLKGVTYHYELLAPAKDGDRRHSSVTCVDSGALDGEWAVVFRRTAYLGAMTVPSTRVYAFGGDGVYLEATDGAFGSYRYTEPPKVLEVPGAGGSATWSYRDEREADHRADCTAERLPELTVHGTTHEQLIVVSCEHRYGEAPEFNRMEKDFYARNVGRVRSETHQKGELLPALSHELVRVGLR